MRKNIRWPVVHNRCFALGVDLPWSGSVGIERLDRSTGQITARVQRFFSRWSASIDAAFFSWQTPGRERDCFALQKSALGSAFAMLREEVVRGLHHTQLNLAAMEPYDRAAIFDETNRVIDELGIAWVNEDLGFWSLGGHVLPYPLPPLFTQSGLTAALRNVIETQRSLAAPLVIEFPGFSETASVIVGELHAYDFFREVAQQSGSPVTLDTAHLIGYQWQRGLRGEALFGELERLPLEHCFEIHLSGCSIVSDRWMDHHHGVLLDQQLELLERLLECCPNARVVTYEDPKFDDAGELIELAWPNVAKLLEIVANWKAQPIADRTEQSSANAYLASELHWAVNRPNGADAAHSAELSAAGNRRTGTDAAHSAELSAAGNLSNVPTPAQKLLRLDQALLRLLYSEQHRNRWISGDYQQFSLNPEDAAALCAIDPNELVKAAQVIVHDLPRRMVAGSGRLTDMFARTLSRYVAHHPDDLQCSQLWRTFAASSAFAVCHEVLAAGLGEPIESAFATFLLETHWSSDWLDRDELRREWFSALFRALLITVSPAFRLPPEVRFGASACFAVVRTMSGAELHLIRVAGPNGQQIQGEIPPFLAEWLESEQSEWSTIAARHGISDALQFSARADLQALGILESNLLQQRSDSS